MELSFDGAVETKLTSCGECAEQHEMTTGFLLGDGSAYAVYWANRYPHHNEAYVDMIIGSWVGPEYEDRTTFGCRIGEIDGQVGPQCSLVEGGAVRSDSPMFGKKLTRDEALAHRCVGEF